MWGLCFGHDGPNSYSHHYYTTPSVRLSYIVVMTLAVIMWCGGHHVVWWSSCGVVVIMWCGGHHVAEWSSCGVAV